MYDNYVMIVHPKIIEDLRNDPLFADWFDLEKVEQLSLFEKYADYKDFL